MTDKEPIGFEPIWYAIKRWDISRTGDGSYHGCTGDDVRTILAALHDAGLKIIQNG